MADDDLEKGLRASERQPFFPTHRTLNSNTLFSLDSGNTPAPSATPLQRFLNDNPPPREYGRDFAGSGLHIMDVSQRASSTSLALSPRGSITSPRREKVATFDLSAPGDYLNKLIQRFFFSTSRPGAAPSWRPDLKVMFLSSRPHRFASRVCSIG